VVNNLKSNPFLIGFNISVKLREYPPALLNLIFLFNRGGEKFFIKIESIPYIKGTK